jgi:hypothetical protein
MTELSEEKDLKEFEGVEGENLGEIEYPEDAEVLEVELELPEPEEVQIADQVEEYNPEGQFNNLDVVVDEIVAGQWGKGQDRRRRLEEAGYSHALIQKELVRRINHR